MKQNIIEVIVDTEEFEGKRSLLEGIKIPKDIMEQINDCYVFEPNRFIIEVATIVNETEIKKLQKSVWENLTFNQLEKDKEVYAYLKNVPPNLAYFSKTKLIHQVWHWNGRMDFIDKYLSENGDELNPIIINGSYQNSKGTKWEAWAFGNRSDHNAMPFYTNLKYDDKNPILFKDNRPGETKAPEIKAINLFTD